MNEALALAQEWEDSLDDSMESNREMTEIGDDMAALLRKIAAQR